MLKLQGHEWMQVLVSRRAWYFADIYLEVFTSSFRRVEGSEPDSPLKEQGVGMGMVKCHKQFLFCGKLLLEDV